MKFLQTKPQVKNKNFIFYDLYYTVNKNRDEKEIGNGQNQNNEKYFIRYDKFITANDYIGRKIKNEITRRKMRS